MVRERLTPVFLDTSGLIALFHDADRHHQRAVAWAQQIRRTRRRRVTTTGVLGELGDGFARRRWRDIDPFLAGVCTDPLIEVVAVDCGLIERALELKRRRADKDWGLTDCVSFVMMAERSLNEALSADSDFVQAGFRALLLDA